MKLPLTEAREQEMDFAPQTSLLTVESSRQITPDQASFTGVQPTPVDVTDKMFCGQSLHRSQYVAGKVSGQER